VVQPKPAKAVRMPNKKKRKNTHQTEATSAKKKRVTKDEENFIQYVAKDHHTEAGYICFSVTIMTNKVTQTIKRSLCLSASL
jgi:hypothetical protein